MGTVGDNIYKELLVMLTLLVTVGLSSFVAAQLPDHLKALCPAYPNCDNALLAEYDKIHKASLIRHLLEDHRLQLQHLLSYPVPTIHFVMSTMLLWHRDCHVPTFLTVIYIMLPLPKGARDLLKLQLQFQ